MAKRDAEGASETYNVRLHDEAQKHLARHDRKQRERILAKLATLQDQPRPLGAEPLEGCPGVLRIRLGGLRILYRVNDERREVLVEAVTPRGQAYKGRRLQPLTRQSKSRSRTTARTV